MIAFAKIIIITELLFNPARNGFDYVEVYNNSQEVIDLARYYIANRNSSGEIANKKLLARNEFLVQPGKHFVITAGENWLRRQYRQGDSILVCALSSLPSYPDDEGTVVLMMEDSVADELSYSEKWHNELVADRQGVALERIDYSGASQDRQYWTSASSSSGYGTPGAVNSHFRSGDLNNGGVTVYPPIFSPNNDGTDDFTTIDIKRNEPGWIASSVVYDVSGRRVRYLLKNELLGIQNRFNWYGVDDRLNPLSSGIYIIHIELFNRKVSVEKYRKSVVISSAAY